MSPSLDYILSNVSYDLLVDGTLKYHGNIDYVSSHFADGHTNKMIISDNQPKDIAEFISKYKDEYKLDNTLTLEEFYRRNTI